MIFAGSLINPPRARAGFIDVSVGGVSVFTVNFNINLNIGPETKSLFSVNYSEDLVHLDFVANANTYSTSTRRTLTK
jgi:hypothetical protein